MDALNPLMNQVPSRPASLSVIEACSLFKPLDEEQRRRLVVDSTVVYAERGELLWPAGSPAEYVCVVGVGFVKMTKISPQGAEMAMELLGPGQCLGMLAAIEGRDLPLSAVAVTNAWYLRIPARSLMAVYSESPPFKDQIIKSIGPRLRKAHDMMSRLSSGRVEERMAAVLLILMDSYGEPSGTQVRLAVPLTRQDLAEMAGTTVETAIRVMSRWQKDGLISTDRQVITVLREDLLSASLR
jgi:CRP/FNR family transcriptional regulator, nitrogen oxide reductase regulator